MRFLATLSSFTAVTAVAIAVSDTPFPETGIAWRGPVDHGGPNVTLYGAHHEVTEQLRQLNPYWWNPTTPFNASHSEAEHEKLEKRGRVAYQCNQPIYGYAVTSAIGFGIQYIYDHYGNGECGAAPYSCGRFSCSEDSAILLCNAGSEWTWTTCWWLATNANFITETCRHATEVNSNNEYLEGDLVEGQAFYEDPTYNVLIKQTGPGNGC